MKNLSFIFIVCFLHIATCQVIHAQKKASLIANWEVGDTYTFEVSKSEIFSQASRRNWNKKQEFISTFEVIEKDSEAYTIKWVRHLDLEKYHIPEELHDEFSHYKTFEAIYKTDLKGRFVGIVNREELEQKIFQMYDDGLDLLKKEKSKIQDAFMRAYSSDVEVGIFDYNELDHFHYLYGLEYPLQEKIDFLIEDKIYDNPAYKDLFMDVSLYVSEMDENQFTISKNVTLDDTTKLDFLSELLVNAGDLARPYNRLKKKSKLDFERNIVYQFDHKKAIPDNFEATQKIVVSNYSQLNRDSYQVVSLRRLGNILN